MMQTAYTRNDLAVLQRDNNRRLRSRQSSLNNVMKSVYTTENLERQLYAANEPWFPVLVTHPADNQYRKAVRRKRMGKPSYRQRQASARASIAARERLRGEAVF